MSALALALHRGVHDALAADATVQAAGIAVCDHVPDHVAPPYLVLRPGTVRPWAGQLMRGAEITYSLHLWSAAAGRLEALRLMGLIGDCLKDGVAVIGGRLVLMFQELAEIRDDAGLIQAIMRYRALLEEEE
ncbi:MAG TPA: DUF3168 domain-containing protein [Sphingomonadales bacterium]